MGQVVPTSKREESPRLNTTAWHFRGVLAALVLLCVTQAGCLHRRITVRSDPPGALVMIDGEERGYTPYSMDFHYYGTHEIQLVKPGFETLTVYQKVPRPWYQYLPIEFFADNLWPFQTTNRNEFLYQMQPQVVVPTDQLLDRASRVRGEAQIGP